MREIFGGLVFLALLAAVFVPLERRFRVRPVMPLFARARLADLAHWIVGGPLGRLAAEIAVILALLTCVPAIVSWRSGLTRQLPWPLVLVLADFFGYWAHRALHSPALWPFHSIHHSSRELDWFSAVRNHPLGEAVARIIGGVPLVILGIDPRSLAWLAPIVGLWGVFLHSNVRWSFGPLRFVVATPLFHRWHHSREPEARDKNFAGLFPVWDLAFGTWYMPERQPVLFGVDEDVPAGFVGQMMHPIRVVVRRGLAFGSPRHRCRNRGEGPVSGSVVRGSPINRAQ